jgi:hypothetical protein
MSRRYLLPLALMVAALALPSSAGAYVFWTAAPLGQMASVARINADGTGLSPSIAGDVTFPTVVANSRYIYFQSQVIEGPGPEELGVTIWIRTNLDGGERVDLPGIPYNTAAIAVDEEHIYWEEPDGVNPPGISRAKLDGSDPEILYLTGLEGLGQYFAVYQGFLYWTYRYCDCIGRANLATKVVQEEFVPEFSGTNIPEEPLGIAVDSQGIFWTYHETAEGEIGHAGLGGGSASLRFIGPAESRRAPIAITGSELYWMGPFGIAHAHLEGNGASVVDQHFVDDPGETFENGLAANSASSPPAPAPPPPPGLGTPPGSSAGPVPTPVKAPPPPPSLSVPKLKLNAKAGTAALTVAVPGPGKLVLSGAGVKRLSKTAKAAATVMLNVLPSATTVVKLRKYGRAKVTAQLTFTPPGGPPTHRTVSLTLKLR